MASHTTHVVPYRRKREGKTNYKKRLALLKSGLPRMVIRKTNQQIIVQIVQYLPDGDKVIAAANSMLLKKHGWKYSCKNTPAAYLVGYALGAKAKGKVNDVILDLGLQVPIKGSKLYAVAKGAGEHFTVRVDNTIVPPDERINGKHISAHFIKNKDPFTGYAKLKADPSEIEKEVSRIKSALAR
ncbi:MAG: 50S ribosomal protein L18 [Candidatus Woesearchaeota archaeon]